MLQQRPSEGHVDHLHAAADGHGRHLELDGDPDQGDLEAVLDLGRRVVVRTLARAVQVGVDVRVADEQEAVGVTEQPSRRPRSTPRRHHEGLAAGPVHRLQELDAQ